MISREQGGESLSPLEYKRELQRAADRIFARVPYHSDEADGWRRERQWAAGDYSYAIVESYRPRYRRFLGLVTFVSGYDGPWWTMNRVGSGPDDQCLPGTVAERTYSFREDLLQTRNSLMRFDDMGFQSQTELDREVIAIHGEYTMGIHTSTERECQDFLDDMRSFVEGFDIWPPQRY